jgi:hypothetical protein
MKTLILIIITLLVATPCFAGSGTLSIGLSGTAGAAGTTGKVGDSTQEAGAGTFLSGYVLVYRAQASSSGALANAHIYHATTNNQGYSKVIIFASSTTTPQSADALVTSSAQIDQGTTTGWKSNTISGNVTSGNYYWVGVLAPAITGTWEGFCNSTISMYYKTLSNDNMYDAPATNFTTMGTGWSEAANSCPCSIHVD